MINLQQIRQRCEAVPWPEDLPVCIEEIDRLWELVKTAYREGGDKGMREGIKDDGFDEDNYLWDHSKAKKALDNG